MTVRKVCRHQRCNQKPYIENKTIQWPKEKGQIIIYKILHRKLKTEQPEPYQKPVMNSGAPEG